MRGLLRWRYWDLLALCAGVAPLFLSIAASLLKLHYGGEHIFIGSAGTLLWLVSLICVAAFAIGAGAGWRSGDRRLIVGGGLVLTLSATPSLGLLLACFSGDCL